MRLSILNKFYHPTLFFFLLPFLQISLGMTYSLRYQTLNLVSFIFLYLFVLFNQMLENILLRIPDNEFNFSKSFFAGVQVLNILTILYFGLQHSWLTSLFLLLFSLNIQGQFLFNFYDLEIYGTVFSVILKTLFLNSFSFFIGAGFVQTRFIIYFLGLLIPLFLYEVSRIRPEMNIKMLQVLITLSYIVGLILLWPSLTVVSLILLLSIPFAWGLTNEAFNRKTSSVFMINFSLFYMLLSMYSVLIS